MGVIGRTRPAFFQDGQTINMLEVLDRIVNLRFTHKFK